MATPSNNKQFRLPLALATAVLAAQSERTAAQAYYGEPLEVPELTLPQVRYLKMDVSSDQASYQSKQGNVPAVNTQRMYLAPEVGIGWDYFLYHPNLLSFSVLAEPGYNLDQYQNNGNSSSTSALLLNGTLNGQLLREKDYATTLNYSRTHDDIHYDFFNSATVDAQGWSVSTGYRSGPVPFSVTFQQEHADDQTVTQDTVTDQTGVTLHAHNDRSDLDATDLTWQFSQMSYNTAYQLSSFTTDNTYDRVSVTDTEHFKKSSLTSLLLYNDNSSPKQSSSQLNLTLNYHLALTPSVSSFSNYGFSDYSGTGLDSVQNFGTVGLSHQLYESLGSTVNLHGSTLNTSALTGSQDSTTVGAGYGENYTKRLGEGMRLSLGNEANYDMTDQQVSGSEVSIANESYTVPVTMQIRLNTGRDVGDHPVVTKNNIPLVEGTDFVVSTATDPWTISFFNVPPNFVKSGDVVAVSYSVQSNPSGTYSVFSDTANLSLRFWHERAEVFARFSLVQNHSASPDFVLEDEQEYAVGADYSQHGFSVQGSFMNHHSTLYDYQNLMATENYSHPVSLHSTAGISLSQQWNTYPAGNGSSTNQAQTATFFNVMLHYDWRPLPRMSWRSEAGVQQQTGLINGGLFLAGRTYLNWALGQLELHLGYEHENQDYTGETRTRDYVFLRMRRNF